ncbi:MAG TPA: lysophospholipid acyltransferase family protein [Sphingomicrobium sp.]|nr:lysophospholipid acyltransferase family protein [Sphingomicrobium sp.]
MIAAIIIGLTRFLVGGTGLWLGCSPSARQRIYFANHSSHLDTIILWAAMPPDLRRRVRPVAAADYWGKGRLQRYIALKVLNAVLVERKGGSANPLVPLQDSLRAGDSLIIFPEGTRGLERLPDSFKGGLYHLAHEFPEVELVPVFLDNLRRAFPKGSLVPVPISCIARFGAPMALAEGETRPQFLERARAAVEALA